MSLEDKIVQLMVVLAANTAALEANTAARAVGKAPLANTTSEDSDVPQTVEKAPAQPKRIAKPPATPVVESVTPATPVVESGKPEEVTLAVAITKVSKLMALHDREVLVRLLSKHNAATVSGVKDLPAFVADVDAALSGS